MKNQRENIDNPPCERGKGDCVFLFFFAVYHLVTLLFLLSLQSELKNSIFMATFDYTTRELREKQALILDKVDAGEDIIIHRGIKKSYMLIPIHEDDYTISEEFREKISKAREDYKAGKGTTCKTFEQSMSLLESL